MKSILRWLTALGLLALALSGCGGAQHGYPVAISGHTVTQAHSPALAAPKPGTKLPAAIAPVPAPPKVRAAAHANHVAPVSRVAKVIPAHVAARAPPRAAGDVSIATVEQFDSVTVSTVPSWAHYTAGYVDGSWRTYFSLKARGFPVVVGISVSRGVGADCLDMEPGNPGPDAAGPWAKWQFTQGNARPCEYSMLSWFPQINANLRAYGISVCSSATQTHCVREWDANWTYSRHLDTSAPGGGIFGCTQWTDRAYGLNLDESTCATWFYSAPKPSGPSHAQIVSWAHGRAASITGYHRHRCTQPVLTNGTCGQLGWRVNHYQVLLDPTNRDRLVCFGKHANLKAAICQIVRPAVAVWSRARSSTADAAFHLGCQGIAAWGLPKSTPACKALNRRQAYFDRRANHTVATSRF